MRRPVCYNRVAIIFINALSHYTIMDLLDELRYRRRAFYNCKTKKELVEWCSVQKVYSLFLLDEVIVVKCAK